LARFGGGGGRRWASRLCPEQSGALQNPPPWEKRLYEAGNLFCGSEVHAPGMKAYLDCRYRKAWEDAVRSSTKIAGQPLQMQWLDRAWVTYFKGGSTGMSHAMMVSNLIRSVHLFSDHPIIVCVRAFVCVRPIAYNVCLFPSLCVCFIILFYFWTVTLSVVSCSHVRLAAALFHLELPPELDP
jgi:hypothetical protein